MQCSCRCSSSRGGGGEGEGGLLVTAGGGGGGEGLLVTAGGGGGGGGLLVTTTAGGGGGGGGGEGVKEEDGMGMSQVGQHWCCSTSYTAPRHWVRGGVVEEESFSTHSDWMVSHGGVASTHNTDPGAVALLSRRAVRRSSATVSLSYRSTNTPPALVAPFRVTRLMAPLHQGGTGSTILFRVRRNASQHGPSQGTAG